jgi:hypothetical protein
MEIEQGQQPRAGEFTPFSLSVISQFCSPAAEPPKWSLVLRQECSVNGRTRRPPEIECLLIDFTEMIMNRVMQERHFLGGHHS